MSDKLIPGRIVLALDDRYTDKPERVAVCIAVCPAQYALAPDTAILRVQVPGADPIGSADFEIEVPALSDARCGWRFPPRVAPQAPTPWFPPGSACQLRSDGHSYTNDVSPPMCECGAVKP